MSNWILKKELHEKRNAELAASAELLKRAHKENRDRTPQEDSEFEQRHSVAAKLLKEIEAIETQEKAEAQAVVAEESRSGRPNGETRSANPSEETRKAAFGKYIRGQQLDEIERRALTVDGSTSGGEMVPSNVYDQYYTKLRENSVIYSYNPRVDRTTDSRPTPYPIYDDTSNEGEIITAGGTATVVANPATAKLTLGGKIFSSKVIELAKDYVLNAVNAEGAVMDMAARRISIHFDKKCTVGVTGSGEPGGFVPGFSVGKTAAATAAITYNEVLDLIHSLSAPYRNGAFLTMNDTTLLAIRKLVDADGNPIWHHGSAAAAAGMPATIAGVPYIVNPYMASLGAGLKPLAYVNLNAGYVVREVNAAELFVDPFTSGRKYLVCYNLFHLLDGGVVDTSAGKVLQCAAS